MIPNSVVFILCHGLMELNTTHEDQLVKLHIRC